MTIKEAIKQRHMVRKYTDNPIPADLVELLNDRKQCRSRTESETGYRQF